MKVTVYALMGTVVLAASACSGNTFSSNTTHTTFHQSFPATGIHLLTVSNIAGTVRIEGSATPDVRVDAVKNAPSKRALTGIRIETSKSRGALNLATHYDENASGLSGGSVDYTVRVPSTMDVKISNVAGKIFVGGSSGNVSADTEAGSIQATMAHVGGAQQIDLSATTGAVSLTLPRDGSATVSATSTVGTFNSTYPSIEKSRENVVGIHASGKIGAGSARITLKTTTGAITLR